MDLRLAVFTVQTYDLTPEQTAAELARLGYDGVEWRITTPAAEPPANHNFWTGNLCTYDIAAIGEQALAMRALCEAHNLAMPTWGTYLNPSDLNRVEACLAAAAAVGVPMLRVGLPGYNHTVPYDVAFADAVSAWQPVVDLGRRHRVRVLAELHHGALIPSASAARRFLEHWLPEEVGAIYDPGNMVHEGWEHPDLVTGALGPYLAHVHVKNARWVRADEERGAARWRGEMCRLREGQVFWPEILAALARAGYDGWYSTEDFGHGDTREKLADNLAALREWAAEI